jgi:Arc/MetJ family transcription regulator
MRTTIVIPDELYAEAKELAASRPVSEFVREAIRQHVIHLRRQHLAQEMAQGYRAEAESPSLGSEWDQVW